jgi:voltage-gated potassium channel Kch
MESVGLSMALGAFLAGLMLADSQYRHQIEADILPFRGILLGLFFMTVGMGVDFGLLMDNFFMIIGLTVGLMLIKSFIVYWLAIFSGTRHDVSAQAAVLLSQSGEFGFVMFSFAALAGVLENQLAQMLTLIIALTMGFTPISVKLVNVLLQKFYTPKDSDSELYTEFVDENVGHIILAGFGRVGARIGAILSAAEVAYVAIDLSQTRVKRARDQGFPVFFGDASNVKVLHAAGAEHAKMIVIALDDPNNFDRLVPLVRQHYPDIPIHARAKDRHHCADLVNQGATTTVSETLETSLRLTEEILLGSGVDELHTKKVIDEFREDYYSGVVQKVNEDKVVMGELKH